MPPVATLNVITELQGKPLLDWVFWLIDPANPMRHPQLLWMVAKRVSRVEELDQTTLLASPQYLVTIEFEAA